MAGRGAGKTASSVGMMEGACLVSRTDLLAWVNALLQVNLTKVEQCASGAIYCQILDSCHPNSVAMRKVNWTAKAEHEFIPNYKTLQAAFDKNFIEKHVDVDKIIRGKYQDNLEFLQWMKCHWDRERTGEDYDPQLAREGKSLAPWARSVGGAHGFSPAEKAPPLDKENVKPRTPAPKSVHEESDIKKPSVGGRLAFAASRPGTLGSRIPFKQTIGALSARASSGSLVNESPLKASAGAREQALLHKIEELESRVARRDRENEELRDTLDGIEAERDFYFRRLRGVEIMCSTLEAQMKSDHTQLDDSVTPAVIVKDIQGILYVQEEDDAPVQATSEGIDVMA
mmetsp:Transcript_177386/g.568809  ORF Transcript_177386/g.568809 Transcript_177386/m.568809 type:complete len:342 (+) Transcript_177386:95-1120(+)